MPHNIITNIGRITLHYSLPWPECPQAEFECTDKSAWCLWLVRRGTWLYSFIELRLHVTGRTFELRNTQSFMILWSPFATRTGHRTHSRHTAPPNPPPCTASMEFRYQALGIVCWTLCIAASGDTAHNTRQSVNKQRTAILSCAGGFVSGMATDCSRPVLACGLC